MKLSLKCKFQSCESKTTINNKKYYLVCVKQENLSIKVCFFNTDFIKVDLSTLIPDTDVEIIYNCTYKNNKTNLFAESLHLWKNK